MFINNRDAIRFQSDNSDSPARMLLYAAIVGLLAVVRTAQACQQNTFLNTSVTLVGARGVDRVTGCFENTEALEKVSLIQIINETVPFVYEGAFKNLSKLVDIILDGNGIRRIYPGAFQNLQSVYCIRIRHNNIGEIYEGVFNSLPISELNLADNNISVIHANAFNDMQNLNIIFLNDNNLNEWISDWFYNSPKLSVLNFANNSITSLPARAFKNIRGVHVVNNLNVTTNVDLSANKISYIDPQAFDGLEVLGWLFLDKNELNEIDERLFANFKQLDWLKLDQNRLKCIPSDLVRLAPNVKYYLEGNPLEEQCRTALDIKAKNGNGPQQ